MEGVRERGKEGWRSGREGSFYKSGNILKLNSRYLMQIGKLLSPRFQLHYGTC